MPFDEPSLFPADSSYHVASWILGSPQRNEGSAHTSTPIERGSQSHGTTRAEGTMSDLYGKEAFCTSIGISNDLLKGQVELRISGTVGG
jgi:hypothetical protein